MNIQNNPVLREKLAAEYVLGTLKGGARRRFESWLHGDAGLRAAVAGWSGRLTPLSELGRPVTPPARVWNGIERRLQLAPEGGWLERLAFWRNDGARLWGGLALAASTAAIVLAVQLGGRGAVVPDQVAALAGDDARTALVVTADARGKRLSVRVAQDVRVADDRTLQLWAITTAGKTRSLGILPDNRAADLALDARAIGPDVMLLAVSLEPKGGSPNPEAPTGPVLYKGAWTRL